MQRGHIFKRHGAWHVRYRIGSDKAGTLKQESRKLVEVCDEFRTKTSVIPLADKILKNVNSPHLDITQTLAQFVEEKYLPFVEQKRKPSTAHGYRTMFNRYIKSRAAIRLASFTTRNSQNFLDAIEREFTLSHSTHTHIKSFLSGVFAHARRMGDYEGSNPVRDTEIPRGKPSAPTSFYTLDEVKKLVEVLDGTARCAVVVAAWTGLSLGELRGLQWKDIEDDVLTVRRTIWRGQEGTPKTVARGDAVPLLKTVQDELSEYRKRNPSSLWVFENPANCFPLDLATFGTKRIKQALEDSGVEWKGFHAFRRGFATRLHEAGIQDKIIQALLRHSSMSVTMKHYVKATDTARAEAMRKLETAEQKKQSQ